MQTDSWPNDADGDVFQRLDSNGFDFSKTCIIDFNIDFAHWPPSEQAIKAIKRVFPEATMHEDKEEGSGYILFQVNGLLTYECVMETQARTSAIAAEHGGKCDSWGVLH